MERTMNSHIQIPRFILKYFENEKGGVWQLDVDSMTIKRGHSKSLNTQLGYYSNDTEHLLESLIETPFSRKIKPIKEHDFDISEYTVPDDFSNMVKQFICVLLSRSPNMFNEVLKNSIYLQFASIDEKIKPDIAVRYTIENDNTWIFDDYICTFAVNKSPVSFVLPMCGIYAFKSRECQTIMFPIAPNFALVLLHRNGAEQFIDGSRIQLLLFEEEDVVRYLNVLALKSQRLQNYHKRLGYGWVISNNQYTLELLVSDAQVFL